MVQAPVHPWGEFTKITQPAGDTQPPRSHWSQPQEAERIESFAATEPDRPHDSQGRVANGCSPCSVFCQGL